MLTKTHELCPYCENEVEIESIKFVKTPCPICEELIKPCSLCTEDDMNCYNCDSLNYNN